VRPGERLGLKPRARIRAVATVGDEPMFMLAGPMPATERALKKAGMSIGDIDLFEVNEAFAAVPLAFMQHFNVDDSRSTSTAAPSPWGTPWAPPARCSWARPRRA
jgi:acetyl-CoA C-acetyltransferase